MFNVQIAKSYVNLRITKILTKNLYEFGILSSKSLQFKLVYHWYELIYQLIKSCFSPRKRSFTRSAKNGEHGKAKANREISGYNEYLVHTVNKKSHKYHVVVAITAADGYMEY